MGNALLSVFNNLLNAASIRVFRMNSAT